jgi:hypothetical protein
LLLVYDQAKPIKQTTNGFEKAKNPIVSALVKEVIVNCLREMVHAYYGKLMANKRPNWVTFSELF